MSDILNNDLRIQDMFSKSSHKTWLSTVYMYLCIDIVSQTSLLPFSLKPRENQYWASFSISVENPLVLCYKTQNRYLQ